MISNSSCAVAYCRGEYAKPIQRAQRGARMLVWHRAREARKIACRNFASRGIVSRDAVLIALTTTSWQVAGRHSAARWEPPSCPRRRSAGRLSGLRLHGLRFRCRRIDNDDLDVAVRPSPAFVPVAALGLNY